MGGGLGPRSRITEQGRQAALDAAAILQVRRSEVAARLVRGEDCEARVVARTPAGIEQWIHGEIPKWRDLLTVRPVGTLPYMRRALPYNRELVRHGLRALCQAAS